MRSAPGSPTATLSGTFHTVSPEPPFSFADFLDTAVSTVGPPGTELVWVPAAALEAEGITGADLPLWAAEEEDRDLSALDPSRAVAAGLAPRPLAETIADTHAHETLEPTPVARAVGLDPEREAALLSRLT